MMRMLTKTFKEVEKRVRLVAVEDRPAENGDTLNIDFLGIDDVPFAGGG